MTIAEGIAAAKLALDSASKALDLLRYPKIDGEAVRGRITEMQDLVFSAQRALAEAEDENRALKRENHELRDKQATKESLIFASEVYVRRKVDGRLEGPFCPLCWDVDDKLVHLKLYGTAQYGGCPDGTPCRRYDCIVHKVTYFITASTFTHVTI